MGIFSQRDFSPYLYNRIKDTCIIYYASVIELSSYWWPPWCVCIKSWNFVAGTLKIVPELT